jgi:hypothetical protein
LACTADYFCGKNMLIGGGLKCDLSVVLTWKALGFELGIVGSGWVGYAWFGAEV